MRWKRSAAMAVVFLLLLFAVRTVLYVLSEENGIIEVSVDVSKPFYAVYFASPGSLYLVPEFRQGAGTIEERLESLLAGPRLPGLFPILPEGVRLLSYSQRGDVLYLNFSHHLVTNHPGGSTGEIFTVYGIDNTLVGAQGVRRVQILVENRMVSTLAGHLDLTEPLEKDYEILGSSHI
jgi:germination protein M